MERSTQPLVILLLCLAGPLMSMQWLSSPPNRTSANSLSLANSSLANSSLANSSLVNSSLVDTALIQEAETASRSIRRIDLVCFEKASHGLRVRQLIISAGLELPLLDDRADVDRADDDRADKEQGGRKEAAAKSDFRIARAALRAIVLGSSRAQLESQRAAFAAKRATMHDAMARILKFGHVHLPSSFIIDPTHVTNVVCGDQARTWTHPLAVIASTVVNSTDPNLSTTAASAKLGPAAIPSVLIKAAEKAILTARTATVVNHQQTLVQLANIFHAAARKLESAAAHLERSATLTHSRAPY